MSNVCGICGKTCACQDISTLTMRDTIDRAISHGRITWELVSEACSQVGIADTPAWRDAPDKKMVALYHKVKGLFPAVYSE